MFIRYLLLLSVFSVLACKSTPEIKQDNTITTVVEKDIANKIGDLWLDDNTYMVSSTGYPRSDSKDNLRESALKAAYELAYIKIEYAFMKEMKVRDNSQIELIRKIIDKYIAETRAEFVDERYIELTVIVRAKFLRQHLKNNTLESLL